MKSNRKKAAGYKAAAYDIENDTVQMKIYSKKGKEIQACIDPQELGRVKDAGGWYAQWDTDHYNVLTRTEENGRPIKLSLEAFILQTGKNAPITHLNGNVLDFRKCNLEIFERKNRNLYFLEEGDTAKLQLLDRTGRLDAEVLLGNAEALKLREAGHIWTFKRKNNGQPLISACIGDGQVSLQRFLTGCPAEKYVHFINLNPLDCRPQNLEIKDTQSIDSREKQNKNHGIRQ